MAQNTNTNKNNNEINVDVLVKALDDETNEALMNLTTYKINEMNVKILQELQFSKETVLLYMKKLKGYRYVDEIKDVKYGAFIKWIPITDPTYLPLNIGGIICDIKLIDTGIIIVCKNFMHKHYQIKMDECLLFQKLSDQEKIILNALDHLQG